MFRSSITLVSTSLAVLAAAPSLDQSPASAAAGAPAASGGASATAARPAVRSLTARMRSHHVLVGRRIVVRGRAAGYAASVRVSLQRRTGAGTWITVARTRARTGGRYAVRWTAPNVGRRTLRVAVAESRRPAGRVVVYRRALASWYGPGLYGGPLACGGRLHEGTLGVANKTLPCGAKVTVRFRGRSVRVPVVDRGPYVGDREFDLTGALRNRLRFDGVGTVLVSR